MAFNVTLYTFSKRTNSTAKPTGGSVFSGLLREPCGVIRPSVSFEFAAGVNPSAYNYAYIPDFGRYYFVNEWTSVGRLWVCSMEVDALASWREEIGQTSAYILRSSAEYNGNLTDNLYPISSETFTLVNNIDVRGDFETISDGSYIVGIINKDNLALGAVSYYIFSQADFRKLCDALLGTTDYLGYINDISSDLLKSLVNPFQYIASCIWFPFVQSGGTTVTELSFGWWTLPNISARKLPSAAIYFDYSIPLPQHPQSKSRGRYLNNAPFSSYIFSMPPYGVVPLPPLANESGTDVKLNIREYVDFITGKSELTLSYSLVHSTSFLKEIGCRSGQMGIPIALSQISTNISAITQTLGSSIGAVGNLLSGNIGGAIASGISAVGSALSVADMTVLTSGSNGGFASLFSPLMGKAYVTGSFSMVSEESLSQNGRPLCESRLISSIPGYIITMNAAPSIPCTNTELEMIRQIMDSGFYYEEGD